MTSFFSKKSLGSFVEGNFLVSGQKSEHISVVTKEKLTTLYRCNASDVNTALKSTLEAQKKLSTLSSYERADILHKMGSLMVTHKDEIAPYLTHEVGKTLKEAEAEVLYTASYFHWNAEEAVRITDKRLSSRSKNKKLLLSYKPIGPCFFVSPWNFPLAMAGRKVAPAIAAGCSCIVKPCKEAPLTMLTLARIAQLAHLPKGVLNILIGDQQTISKPLLEAKTIKKLSFTGSLEVGKTLYHQSAKTLKKITMELGGNAPFIVFDDADLDLATDQALLAKLRNNGQTCVAANRFLVQKPIHDDFVKLLKQKVSKLKIGNPLSKTIDLSNIVHPTTEKKMKDHIEDALQKGAKTLLKAKKFYEPEILVDVKKTMKVYKEENFGPVMPILSFTKDKEAITLANDTNYGLAAYAFTSSLKRSHLITDELHFGMIGLNDGLISAPEFSFGGIKDSGFGREGGPNGIYEYLIEIMISEKL